jgi:hypothetical protein
LFSHEGVTGPAALELSQDAFQGMRAGGVVLAYDFAPHVPPEDLDGDLLAAIEDHRGKTLRNILELRLPDRLVPAILASAHVDGTTKGYVLGREQRRAVVNVLKQWAIGVVAGVDIGRGEVTAGGVALNEVDPHTMGSRVSPGLYLAGEILDVAGRVGGYNLQAAFSTGVVAGESSAARAGHRPAAGITIVEGSSSHA